MGSVICLISRTAGKYLLHVSNTFAEISTGPVLACHSYMRIAVCCIVCKVRIILWAAPKEGNAYAVVSDLSSWEWSWSYVVRSTPSGAQSLLGLWTIKVTRKPSSLSPSAAACWASKCSDIALLVYDTSRWWLSANVVSELDWWGQSVKRWEAVDEEKYLPQVKKTITKLTREKRRRAPVQSADRHTLKGYPRKKVWLRYRWTCPVCGQTHKYKQKLYEL